MKQNNARRRNHNPRVGGSSPSSATTCIEVSSGRILQSVTDRYAYEGRDGDGLEISTRPGDRPLGFGRQTKSSKVYWASDCASPDCVSAGSFAATIASIKL